MATFDEKELLWDEMYNIVSAVMFKKVNYDEDIPKEWRKDNKKLNDFRDWIADTPHEEINFDEAFDLMKKIKDKYASMPDKW